MDTLTHTLLGAALAKTSLGRTSPFAPVALVLGTNLPDFENLVLAFVDKPTNMINHRSITHAVVGLLILIPLFTLLIRGLEHLRYGKHPPGRFWPLLGALAIAITSHPLLDWLNTYGVRPWLPFDGTWYHGDLVFILDPYIWLLIGGALALAGRRSWLGSVTLALLALATTALIITAAHGAPPALPAIWLTALTALIVARTAGVGRRHANAVVVSALAIAAAYVGFLGWAGHRAWAVSEPVLAAALPHDEHIIRRTLSPQAADPFRWQVIAETPVAIYRHTITLGTPPPGVVRRAKHLDDPLVRHAADSHAGEAWRTFARHPVAAVADAPHGKVVYLLDARYGLFPPRDFSSFTIPVPAAAIIPQSQPNTTPAPGN